MSRRKQRPDVSRKARVRELSFHVLLELRARHVMPAPVHVFGKGLDDPLRIDFDVANAVAKSNRSRPFRR